jgi:hypothetical protein
MLIRFIFENPFFGRKQPNTSSAYAGRILPGNADFHPYETRQYGSRRSQQLLNPDNLSLQRGLIQAKGEGAGR